MTKKALVAVDLGGESCRVSLSCGGFRGTRACSSYIDLRNESFGGLPASLLGHRLCIYDGVEKGIRLCAEAANEGIASIGVDGWGVDYVRMKPNGEPLNNPFSYRDERTVAAEEQVHKIIPREKSLQSDRYLNFYALIRCTSSMPIARMESTEACHGCKCPNS